MNGKQDKVISRHWRFVLLLSLAAINVTGCGGTTESDMRRYAIRRDSGEDETTESTESPAPPEGATAAAEEGALQSVDPTPASAGASSQGSVATASTSIDKSDAETALAPQPPAAPETAEPGSMSDEVAITKTVENLRTIGEALERYHAERGVYPPAAITYDRRPLLSWRVELLPYLGYTELYNKFLQDEAWDGPNNKKLLALIPSVYQLPNRRDQNTNYQAVVGDVAAFDPIHGRTIRAYKDGAHNTVFLVEADESAPWTKPDEFELDGHRPLRGLGGLRSGSFFAIWGGGNVGRISASLETNQATAMFTIDGGERFLASDVHQNPQFIEPSPSEVASASDHADDAPMPVPPTLAASDTDGDAPEALGLNDAHPLSVARHAVPSESEQQQPLALFRELYQDRYKACRTPQERSELAGELLAHVDKVSGEPVAQFVLLNLAGQIAAESGDLARAREAGDKLLNTFVVRRRDVCSEIVRRMVPVETVNGDLSMLALQCAEDAFLDDDYAQAGEMMAAATTFHKKQAGHQNAALLAQLRRRIDQGERAYADVKRAFRQLEQQPDSGIANRQIGEYYCLIKDDWKRGLPFLLKSDHAGLAEIARLEVEQPSRPESQVELADAWWNYGDERPPLQRACRLRARHWYERVTRTSDSGIAFVKAEVRLRECERLLDR